MQKENGPGGVSVEYREQSPNDPLATQFNAPSPFVISLNHAAEFDRVDNLAIKFFRIRKGITGSLLRGFFSSLEASPIIPTCFLSAGFRRWIPAHKSFLFSSSPSLLMPFFKERKF